MKYLYIIIAALLLTRCHPKYANPHIEIQTKFGDIEVELFPAKAPKTVAAFLSYVDSGFYKNSYFYRVLTDDKDAHEIIRAPIPNTRGKIVGERRPAKALAEAEIRAI